VIEGHNCFSVRSAYLVRGKEIKTNWTGAAARFLRSRRRDFKLRRNDRLSEFTMTDATLTFFAEQFYTVGCARCGSERTDRTPLWIL